MFESVVIALDFNKRGFFVRESIVNVSYLEREQNKMKCYKATSIGFLSEIIVFNEHIDKCSLNLYLIE